MDGKILSHFLPVANIYNQSLTRTFLIRQIDGWQRFYITITPAKAKQSIAGGVKICGKQGSAF